MQKNLTELYINPHLQDLYAIIIAIEDMEDIYGNQLILNLQPNQGETNNEL